MDNYDMNSDINWKRAQQAHFKAETYYDSLDDADKRWLDNIRAQKVGNYDAFTWQVSILAEMHGNNAIDAFSDIFHFGFMKGKRAEHARMKKKAQKKTNKG